MKPLKVIDLYCGAGGTSTGLMQAANKAGRKVDLTSAALTQTYTHHGKQ